MLMNKSLLLLLDAKQRRQFWKHCVTTMMAALVEVASIVSVMPFFALVSKPEVIHTSSKLQAIYRFVGADSDKSFIILAGMATLTLLAIGNAVIGFDAAARQRYSWGLSHDIAIRLFRSYLRRPYSFFLERNSTDLTKNILMETRHLVIGYLTPLLDLISRGAAVVLVVTVLMLVDPVVALAAFFVLSTAYGLIYVSLRRSINRSGSQQLRLNKQRSQTAHEVFAGIKEVRTTQSESFFLERYSVASEAYTRHQATNHIVSETPKFALEVVAFGLLIISTLVLLSSGGSLVDAMPMLVLYAASGYRLIPALQKCFSAMAKMRFNSHIVTHLAEELAAQDSDIAPSDTQDSAPEVTAGAAAVDMRDLCFSYAGAPDHRKALDRVNLRIERGELIGIVGPTGSGKTTMIDLILGLLSPGSGELNVLGQSMTDATRTRVWRRVSYVPQHIFLCDDTIAYNVALGADRDALDLARVEQCLRLANVWDHVNALPEGMQTVVGDRGVRLSGGERQRIGIARALYRDCELMVLDEATSALDNTTEKKLIADILHIAPGKTILMIAHRLSSLKHCDRIYVISRGHLTASGSFEELSRSSPEFQVLLHAAQLSEGTEAALEQTA